MTRGEASFFGCGFEAQTGPIIILFFPFCLYSVVSAFWGYAVVLTAITIGN